MFIVFKLIALGITGWLLMQTFTLKYAWTRELSDLDWSVLGQPVNVVMGALAVILLLVRRRERS